jgi:hypothetical protein
MQQLHPRLIDDSAKGRHRRGQTQENVPGGQARPAPPAASAPDRPTTFQLAQLAAILATRPDSLRIPPAEVVLEALQVWDAAAKVNLAEQQEREIWAAVFTDAKEQWDHRLGAYVGDEARLQEMLSEPRFQPESEALPKLFPGTAETPESRRQKLDELMRAAQTDPALNKDQPAPQKFSARFVRALVDAQGEAPSAQDEVNS